MSHPSISVQGKKQKEFTNSENGLSIANVIVKAAFGSDQPSLTWLKQP
jgi:hypothetical protein